MKAYQIRAGAGIASLERVERDSARLGPNDIRVRLAAAAMNYRDISFARGQFHNTPSQPLIPLVDGCGEVAEVGSAVGRFKAGDRVIPGYYPLWSDGAIDRVKTSVSFGAQIDGTLAEELVANEEFFVSAPKTLDAPGAAALSCAGLTAWNALFVAGAARPG